MDEHACLWVFPIRCVWRWEWKQMGFCDTTHNVEMQPINGRFYVRAKQCLLDAVNCPANVSIWCTEIDFVPPQRV